MVPKSAEPMEGPRFILLSCKAHIFKEQIIVAQCFPLGYTTEGLLWGTPKSDAPGSLLLSRHTCALTNLQDVQAESAFSVCFSLLLIRWTIFYFYFWRFFLKAPGVTLTCTPRLKDWSQVLTNSLPPRPDIQSSFYPPTFPPPKKP